MILPTLGNSLDHGMRSEHLHTLLVTIMSLVNKLLKQALDHMISINAGGSLVAESANGGEDILDFDLSKGERER